MVKAGQLSQPLDRPQGLQSAINPSAASGAADPATPDDARRSAPLPTLTIGRVVSLEDYENYARAFAGVAKVVATWTWFGSLRGVFLSVAGAAGAVLAIDDPVIVKLVAALQQHGNPYVPIRVAPYVPVLFRFTAAVLVDRANYDTQQVLAQVWQNLSTAFSFQQRQLAQNVAAGEIIEIIQQTAGVTAVQLQALTLTGESPSAQVPARLCAAGPTPPDGAQMLLLDPQTQAQIGVWS